MVGMAIFVFLGEVFLGTLLFVAFAMLVKFWAEHQESARETAVEPEAEKSATSSRTARA